MDKAEFIRAAPDYYALAVVLEITRIGLTHDRYAHISESDLMNVYSIESRSGPYCFLQKEWLLRQALEALVERQALVVDVDPFGPTLYKRGEGFEEYVSQLEGQVGNPFSRSKLASDRAQWLQSALVKLNETCDDLKVTAEDFTNPEAEWEPISIERDSDELKAVITALDKTVKEVEQSNGYASEHPEEQKFVLDNLRMLAVTLKTAATTSLSYVKVHGLNVLRKLQNRFGDALIGDAAKETSKAILSWLKEVAKSLL